MDLVRARIRLAGAKMTNKTNTTNTMACNEFYIKINGDEAGMKSFTKDEVMAYLEFIKNPSERQMIWNRLVRKWNPRNARRGFVVIWNDKESSTHEEAFEEIVDHFVEEVHRHVEFNIVPERMRELRKSGAFADDDEEEKAWKTEWAKWDWTAEEKEARRAKGKEC
jgi:hypothetical protein